MLRIERLVILKENALALKTFNLFLFTFVHSVSLNLQIPSGVPLKKFEIQGRLKPLFFRYEGPRNAITICIQVGLTKYALSPRGVFTSETLQITQP